MQGIFYKDMATFRQIVYMVIDELKGISDDFTFTEEHILFLVGKYRNLLLEQKAKQDFVINPANYQTVCLSLENKNITDGDTCDSVYLRSVQTLPDTLSIGSPKIYSRDLLKSRITFVSFERLRVAGMSNPFLRQFIYCAIGPDKHLYFKSGDIRHKYLESVRVEAIFNNIEEAATLACENADGGEEVCDVMDTEFPCEDSLIPQVIASTLKEMVGASYRPKDPYNNANDDMSSIQQFIRANMKDRYLKQTGDE